MVLSLGIDYCNTHWNLCLVEDERPVESVRTTDAVDAIKRLSASRQDLASALSSALDAPFGPLQALLDQDQLAANSELYEVLAALTALSKRSYVLPSLSNLSSVPAYRRALHPQMGSAQTLCALATLLQHMRRSEAAWGEMRLLFLEIGALSHTLAVVQDGEIVDGIGPIDAVRMGLALDAPDLLFWEGLTQNLAGLLAVHHFEDIVLFQRDEQAAGRTQQVIERLGDLYQCYLYPESDVKGFESAYGAALLAGGLSRRGPAAALSKHLLGAAALT